MSQFLDGLSGEEGKGSTVMTFRTGARGAVDYLDLV
jgi:hypothetical protein